MSVPFAWNLDASAAPPLQTEVLQVDPFAPSPAHLARAGAVIREGGLVAFPTETVYGLGAAALNPSAVRRIFIAKGRPSADPLIVHVANMAALERLTSGSSPWLTLLLPFWPGPLTVILPRASAVPLEVTAGLETVAVRMPAHPVALALLEAAGEPIAAPSANRFTRPSPTRASHVLEDLTGRFELLLDGGPTPHGLESSIVDCSGDRPRLLRHGAIPAEVLLDRLPELEVPDKPLLARPDAPMRAPGTQLKHYAPRAPVTLFLGAHVHTLSMLQAELTSALSLGLKVGVIGMQEALGALSAFPIETASLGGSLEEAGARLFDALRALDARQVSLIFCIGFPEQGLGRTLNDRLYRAAEGRVRVLD